MNNYQTNLLKLCMRPHLDQPQVHQAPHRLARTEHKTEIQAKAKDMEMGMGMGMGTGTGMVHSLGP